ncbi:MAG: ABC transporter substrate-binding protein [Desulfobacterales bacterium]|nr:ABC transporter substrate-binding protein [Desulfobacterales bacterium]
MKKWKLAWNAALTIFAVFAITVMVPITGCTKKEEDETRTVIRFVTWKPNQPEVWEEIFRRFEAEHPDIRVVREVGPHSTTAFHDLLTQKLKNRSPDVDVFFMDVIWPPEFASAGWALPLDERFPHSEQEKFLSGAILANSYKGRIYGVPLFVGSGMLYYRKDLLKRYGFTPPDTWQEMVEQAWKIVSEEGKQRELYGFSGQFKQYEGLVCDMMEYILSNQGSILNPKTGGSEIAKPAAVGAVRFVRDSIIGAIAPKGVLTYQEPESIALFIQGKAVFHRNWPYAWEMSNNPKRSKIVGKVGITKLPHFPGGTSHATLGGWQLGISKYSQNKKAAWTFVRFLTSKKIQKCLALKAGLAPTRKALYEDHEIIKAHPQFWDMKEVFLTAYPRPRTPLYPALSNVLQHYFHKVISDPNSDIEKEAFAASQEIDRILQLAQ